MGMKLKNHDKVNYENQPHIKPHLDFLEKIFNDKGDDKKSETDSEYDKIISELNFEVTNKNPVSEDSQSDSESGSDDYNFSNDSDISSESYSIPVSELDSKPVSDDSKYDKIISELNFEVTNKNTVSEDSESDSKSGYIPVSEVSKSVSEFDSKYVDDDILNNLGPDEILEGNNITPDSKSVSELGSKSDSYDGLNNNNGFLDNPPYKTQPDSKSGSDYYDYDISELNFKYDKIISELNFEVTNKNPVSDDSEYDKIISELNFEVTNITPDSKNVSDSDNIENIVINNKVDKVKTIYYEDEGKIKKREIKYGKT